MMWSGVRLAENTVWHLFLSISYPYLLQRLGGKWFLRVAWGSSVHPPVRDVWWGAAMWRLLEQRSFFRVVFGMCWELLPWGILSLELHSSTVLASSPQDPPAASPAFERTLPCTKKTLVQKILSAGRLGEISLLILLCKRSSSHRVHLSTPPRSLAFWCIYQDENLVLHSAQERSFSL